MKKLNVFENDQLVSKDIYDNMLSAYSEEISSWYFYLITRDFLVGDQFKEVEKLFEKNGKDELEDHAYWLLERMNQLNLSPEPVSKLDDLNVKAFHKYIVPLFNADGKVDTLDILEKAKQSEEAAIETYQKLIQMTDRIDPVSNLKYKEILSDEEEHLSDIMDMIDTINHQ